MYYCMHRLANTGILTFAFAFAFRLGLTLTMSLEKATSSIIWSLPLLATIMTRRPSLPTHLLRVSRAIFTVRTPIHAPVLHKHTKRVVVLQEAWQSIGTGRRKKELKEERRGEDPDSRRAREREEGSTDLEGPPRGHQAIWSSAYLLTLATSHWRSIESRAQQEPTKSPKQGAAGDCVPRGA